ncbi:unnamed protein product, partial [marine sediment metagenome]
KRNEDKTKIVLDYFDERPTVFSYGNMPPILQFPRPISAYLNELVKNNLVLGEMSEPKASKEDIVLWMPNYKDEEESQEFPHKAWGSERILSLGRHPNFKKLDTLNEFTPKSTWDALAPAWLSVDEENYHHKYRILPEVYRMLNVQKDDKILDVACGKGDVARDLAGSGAKVTGIDISKMLEYAIEEEEKEKLGITYLELNAENIIDKFERASFDKVVCNMALMDIEDYKKTIQQISFVLRENGIFVFSITHPVFAYPTCTSVNISGR